MPSLASFKFDRKKAEEGVWVDIYQGLRFLIARMPNSRLEQRLAKVGKAQQRALRFGGNAELLKGTTMEAVAHCVLLNWEGLTKEDNVTPIPYSPATAVALFEEYPEFFRTVVELAQDQSLFQDDNLGNSLST
jgi:hypothetical protein